ncbi:MAG: hypothetical protein J6L98_02630, partial [Bacteroidales bacterium]|nr:hypothetical protein [Bacteroidales bacterium]
MAALVASVISCDGGAPTSQEESDFRMMIRLWPAHHNNPELSSRLIQAFKEYDFCDEVWFCGEGP